MLNQDNINEYIYNYCINDKINSAIMLTAPWGTGKSYYIKNSLVKYLEHKKIKTIIISMYSIKAIDEINDNIINETILGRILNDNRFSFIKSIGKGFVSKLTLNSVNLDDTIDSIKKILTENFEKDKSIKYLLIFEDIERSNINILDFLGYINNLVEQYGTKILLVANEEVILSKSSEYKNVNEKKELDQIKIIEEYKKIKEKTVGDTINYKCNYDEVVNNIINTFNINEYISSINYKEIKTCIGYVLDIIGFNLRSFIYACQKTHDIYDNLPKTILNSNEEFIKCIFFSNIIFCANLKNDEKKVYIFEKELLSNLDGISYYPLFKFSYDYIIEQKSIPKTEEELQVYLEAYNDYLNYTINIKDDDINKIKNFSYLSEKEIDNLYNIIYKRLINNDIKISCYSELLVAFAQLEINEIKIPFEVSTCLKYMYENLKNIGNKLKLLNLRGYSYNSNIKELKPKIDEYIKYIFSELECKNFLFDIDYTPDGIKNFYNNRYNNKYLILYKSQTLIKSLDINKFIDVIKKSQSDILDNVRCLFIEIYRDYYNKYMDKLEYEQDIKDLELFKTQLDNIKLSAELDSVQKYHIREFIININKIIKDIKNCKS